MTNWQEIETAGSASEFFQFTAAAYENAAETVYVEKSAPESELGAMFLSTLSDLLANSDDKAARDFFAALGVRF